MVRTWNLAGDFDRAGPRRVSLLALSPFLFCRSLVSKGGASLSLAFGVRLFLSLSRMQGVYRICRLKDGEVGAAYEYGEHSLRRLVDIQILSKVRLQGSLNSV